MVDEIIKGAVDLGIKTLTLFAFSTENWHRAPEEVAYILDLLLKYLHNKTEALIEEGVKLNAIGDISKFPLPLQQKLHEVMRLTQYGSKIELVLALNYGSLF